jgi:hypothetical protein
MDRFQIRHAAISSELCEEKTVVLVRRLFAFKRRNQAARRLWNGE